MSRPLVALLVLALIVPLSGCHMTTHPRVVAEVAAGGGKVSVRPAPYDGEYRLYAAGRGAGPWAQPVGEPLATHRLRRREPVGFRRGPGDALSAVAGEQVIPLERTNVGYLWQMRADAGQLDRNKAVVLAAVALALAFGFAGATVAAAPF
jgi:hypothetical protein